MDREVVILGGAVIDGTGRAPIRDGAVYIAGDRIVNVCRRQENGWARNARVIDASGLTVMPGLIDAHVHVGELLHDRFKTGHPAALCDEFMRHFVRQGVTTVRDTGSPDLGESFQTFKRSRPDWPRLYGSGPNLDGSPGGPWPGLIRVDDPERAQEETARLIERGADFVKIYVWMTLPVLRSVVAVAHANGVRVTGHVGHVVTVEDAVKVGIDAIEHVRVGPELLSVAELAQLQQLAPRRHDPLISFRAWRFARPDSSRADALAELLVERGVFWTPTLVLSRSILKARRPEFTHLAPGVDQMPPAVLKRWNGSQYVTDYIHEDWKHADLEFDRQLAFLGRAHAAGAKVIAGTDTPNPFLAPGFSLHEEMLLLSAAGLSNLEVIMAATIRPAELLGVQNELGTVEKGKLADVILVEGDPLGDLHRIRDIRLVMKGGRVVFEETSLRSIRT